MLRENIAGVGATGSDNPVEGIEQLLGVTGGTLLNLGAADRSAFDRIVSGKRGVLRRDDRSESALTDGRTRSRCASAKTGVDIRASRSITYEQPDSRGTRPAAPSTRDMLSTTAEFRDLPLRAAAFSSFEEPGGQIRVLAIAEAVEPDVKLSALAAALFDRDGKGGWRLGRAARGSGAQPGARRDHGASRCVSPPGRRHRRQRARRRSRL